MTDTPERQPRDAAGGSPAADTFGSEPDYTRSLRNGRRDIYSASARKMAVLSNPKTLSDELRADPESAAVWDTVGRVWKARTPTDVRVEGFSGWRVILSARAKADHNGKHLDLYIHPPEPSDRASEPSGARGGGRQGQGKHSNRAIRALGALHRALELRLEHRNRGSSYVDPQEQEYIQVASPEGAEAGWQMAEVVAVQPFDGRFCVEVLIEGKPRLHLTAAGEGSEWRRLGEEYEGPRRRPRWSEEGHAHLRRRVLRRFHGRAFLGSVVKWLPPGLLPAGEAARRSSDRVAASGAAAAARLSVDEGAALFRVLHDDGDVEELEEFEVEAALEAFEQRAEGEGEGEGEGGEEEEEEEEEGEGEGEGGGRVAGEDGGEDEGEEGDGGSRKRPRPWGEEEDAEVVRHATTKARAVAWSSLAESLGRTKLGCQARWRTLRLARGDGDLALGEARLRQRQARAAQQARRKATAPPPAPAAAVAAPPPAVAAPPLPPPTAGRGMAAVLALLRRFGIEQYAGAFEATGNDDVSLLYSLSDAELKQVAEEVQMKPGHLSRWCGWMAELRAKRAPAQRLLT